MSTQGYRMSHTYVWNVEKSRAHELIHEMLSNILQEQPKEYLPLQELIASMNRRGRQYHIHTQKKQLKMKILVTGGAGFIGSNLIHYLIEQTEHSVVNVDTLTVNVMSR